MVYVLLWILFVVGVSSTTPTQLIEIICGGGGTVAMTIVQSMHVINNDVYCMSAQVSII